MDEWLDAFMPPAKLDRDRAQRYTRVRQALLRGEDAPPDRSLVGTISDLFPRAREIPNQLPPGIPTTLPQAPELPVPEVDFEARTAANDYGTGTPMPAKAPGRPVALSQAVGRTQQPPGVQTAPGGAAGAPGGAAAAPGAVDPLQAQVDKRQKELEAALAEQDRLMQPPDRTAAEEAYKKRAATGEHQLVLALMARRAGLDPFSAHHLKQSAEAVAPMKMAGGTMTETGFIEDPAYQQELTLRRADGRLKQIETALQGALSAQERERLKKMEIEARKDLQQATLGAQAAIAGMTHAYQMASLEERRAANAAKGLGGKTPVDPQHLLNLVGEAKLYLPKATGSGAGRLRDMAYAFVGKESEGAQMAGKLDTIGGQLVMAQPRMEGPQSDADRRLYERMAGDVANSEKPIGVRLAALEQIEKMANNYKTGYWAPPGYNPRQNAGRRATDQPADAGGGIPAGWSVRTR